MTRDNLKELKGNVADAHKTEKNYKVGDRVRRKIPKGKLDKMSTPSWYDQVDHITEVVYPKIAGRPVKYRITGHHELYAKNDLQVVDGPGANSPFNQDLNRAITRNQVRQQLQRDTIQTRSRTAG